MNIKTIRTAHIAIGRDDTTQKWHYHTGKFWSPQPFDTELQATQWAAQAVGKHYFATTARVANTIGKGIPCDLHLVYELDVQHSNPDWCSKRKLSVRVKNLESGEKQLARKAQKLVSQLPGSGYTVHSTLVAINPKQKPKKGRKQPFCY